MIRWMWPSVSAFGIVLLSAGATSADTTLIVSPTGPWRSVADAVRHAPPGSRVIVRAGTYREPAIVIDRSLTMIGENRP
jgi:nitrous oxidase accessory protein